MKASEVGTAHPKQARQQPLAANTDKLDPLPSRQREKRAGPVSYQFAKRNAHARGLLSLNQ